MLTIAKLKRWSINYYNDTARAAGTAAKDARKANGGLGEYYSESETRAPVWVVVGDAVKAASLVGLSAAERAGSAADPGVAERWLDLVAVTAAWKLNARDTQRPLPAVTTALERGWHPAALADHLTRRTDGARDPLRVLGRRLTALPAQRDPPAVAVPWCGQCEDAHSRTITVALADGTEAAQFCPQCSPQFHREAPIPFDPTTH